MVKEKPAWRKSPPSLQILFFEVIFKGSVFQICQIKGAAHSPSPPLSRLKIFWFCRLSKEKLQKIMQNAGLVLWNCQLYTRGINLYYISSYILEGSVSRGPWLIGKKQGWKFALWFFKWIARFLWAKERIPILLFIKKSNRSKSLTITLFKEQREWITPIAL